LGTTVRRPVTKSLTVTRLVGFWPWMMCAAPSQSPACLGSIGFCHQEEFRN
jgi:hypothetical protein